jgi:DNA-binding NtrC family response regulator
MKADILLVDDEPQMLSAMELVVSRMGHTIRKSTSGAEALKEIEKARPDIVISDMRMPEVGGLDLLQELHKTDHSLPVVLITAYGTILQAVEAMKYGAYDFITKPFSAEDLERVIESILKSTEKSSERTPQKSTKSDLSSEARVIITNDQKMRSLLELSSIVAKSSASVLIQGESGTGKELIARFIHSASRRKDGPFVAVNCAALPENLLESELFGHEKGAFTGAQGSKIGKFELAHGGTILLDEVSEMAPLLQAKLLRVLQEREVDRVGGLKPVQVDVRVLATTNRDLRAAVAKGDFREDLLYRLNVIPINIIPLRERQGDIQLLTQHFIKKYSENTSQGISDEAMKALFAHSYPGNIRELQNICQRAVLLAQGKKIEVEHLLLGLNSSQETQVDSTSNLSLRPGMSVAEAEKRLIVETLRSTGQNKTRAAELLGISIRTLRNKLHEYGEMVADEENQSQEFDSEI